jgi:hypothetical protein
MGIVDATAIETTNILVEDLRVVCNFAACFGVPSFCYGLDY